MFEKRLLLKEVVCQIRPEFIPLELKRINKPSETINASTDTTPNTETQSLSYQELKKAYQKGYNIGKIEGEEMARTNLDLALQAIQKVIEKHGQQESEFCEKIESTVQSLSMAIAQKVIRQEVSTNPEIIRNVVGKSLEMIKGEDRVIIKVNPEDIAAIKEQWDYLKDSFINISKWDLNTNPTIERGGCLIETPNETVDARIERQLELIETYFQEGLNNAGNV